MSMECAVVGQEGDCNKHPRHGSQRWCQDDHEWVCEQCIILDYHKEHNNLNETQRIGQMSSRFATMKTSLNSGHIISVISVRIILRVSKPFQFYASLQYLHI